VIYKEKLIKHKKIYMKPKQHFMKPTTTMKIPKLLKFKTLYKRLYNWLKRLN